MHFTNHDTSFIQAGFRTKRFFILRDRTLSYHRHEPRSQEEARSDYAMHSIQLKHYFTVERSSSKLTPCVKVLLCIILHWPVLLRKFNLLNAITTTVLKLNKSLLLESS